MIAQPDIDRQLLLQKLDAICAERLFGAGPWLLESVFADPILGLADYATRRGPWEPNCGLR
jgi:hypothetical protein